MKGAIQRIFREHGDAFVEKNRDHLTAQHLKVIRDIRACGTPEAGWIEFGCSDCGAPHLVERSCGNRMCPSCQTGKIADWLDKRLERQLPTHYFLITFTVPEQLHPLFLHAPKEAYTSLFAAASGALKTLAGNPRHLGFDLPGFFGVLHTWGRVLNFHPHIHFVVPGGGVDKASGLWRSSRADFFAPGQALAKVFRGILRDRFAEHGLTEHCDPSAWQRKWTVDCQAVGHNPAGALKYLAPYTFKTAITDSRIVSADKGKVTFTYVKSGSNRRRRMTLDAHEFIRRYLMHVLPSGFMRIRHYGFLGSGCSIPHQELVALVRIAHAFEVEPVEHTPAEKKPFPCPKCGAKLVPVAMIDSTGRVVADFLNPRPKRE